MDHVTVWRDLEELADRLRPQGLVASMQAAITDYAAYGARLERYDSITAVPDALWSTSGRPVHRLIPTVRKRYKLRLQRLLHETCQWRRQASWTNNLLSWPVETVDPALPASVAWWPLGAYFLEQ